MIERFKSDALKRDRKAGWVGTRHFLVPSDTELSARQLLEKTFPIGSLHPQSSLMRLERIVPIGFDLNGGCWKFDLVYWLPRSRNIELEIQAAAGSRN